MLDRIINKCNNDKVPHHLRIEMHQPISWTDVYEFFTESVIMYVRLISNGKEMEIPLNTRSNMDIYQDRDFILAHIASGSTFEISKFINKNPLLFKYFEEYCDAYNFRPIDVVVQGSISCVNTNTQTENSEHFILQVDGKCEYVINSAERVTMTPGNLLYIPPNSNYSCASSDKSLSLITIIQ